MHWPSIIVATLIPMILGMIWYNPKVLGVPWQKETGLSDDDIKNANMGAIYGVALLLAFCLSMGLTFIIRFGHDAQEVMYQTWGHGAFHGVLFAVLLALPVLVTNSLFERKSTKLILINAGYWVLCWAIMGAIVNGWR